jgi:Protein of unknown function (DUF4231)
METDASELLLWRSTTGAEPCAVKAARTVLNGGDEETCGNVTRLVPTQLRQQVKAGVRRFGKAKNVSRVIMSTGNSAASTEATSVHYPKLLPRPLGSVDTKTYIAERFNDAISWYDSKAVVAKRWYQWMRAMTVIGGALVPVFVNVNFPYVSVVTTVLSVIVVLLVSLESIFHYREQWVNYRSTEQFLRTDIEQP